MDYKDQQEEGKTDLMVEPTEIEWIMVMVSLIELELRKI